MTKTEASLVDLTFGIMDAREAPLDLALVLHFNQAPSLEALQDGASRAFRAFDKSRCALDGLHWIEKSPPQPISVHHAVDAAQAHALIESLLAQPLHLGTGPLIQQCLITGPFGAQLVTRMHHALGDIVSACLWLSVQLDGRTAQQQPTLQLKKPEKTSRTSPYAFGKPASRIAHQPKVGRSERGFKRLSFRSNELIAKTKALQTFSYNDLLASVALTTLSTWNQHHGGGNRVALWIPVNIREQPFVGFGNGSSRIRVYKSDHAPNAIARALHVRDQRMWCKDNGEWYFPDVRSYLAKLPPKLARWLLKAYCRRPGVDMATALFSHAQRLGDNESHLGGAHTIDIVSHLYTFHPLAMIAAGLGDATHLTFTWDKSLFNELEIDAFVRLFEDARESAFEEVLRA